MAGNNISFNRSLNFKQGSLFNNKRKIVVITDSYIEERTDILSSRTNNEIICKIKEILGKLRRLGIIKKLI